jgi:ABC-2 type transport system ATP-binding protein
VIEATGLTKRFGAHKAVDNLTFTVSPGRVTGFLGPNGAGKSTTCRLMVGLDHGSGTTLFDGRRYRDLPSPMREVGLLLEAKAFHPTRTARNHLRMMCAANNIDARRADECLELVGLKEVARKAPRGFSLGMGQRLGLAAALLGDPKTLILDEPGNGLDPQGIQWLRDLLTYLAAQGRTVLVSSHLLSEMELMAEHVIVIGSGELIADCPTAEFIAQGSQQWVIVRSPDSAALGAALTDRAIDHTVAPDGSISVPIIAGRVDSALVGDTAHAAGVALHELSVHRSSLEAAFLQLTGAANQFAGGTPDPMPGLFVPKGQS